ncbi:hypothetical protein FKM82_016865 [Ascaphus truei]
MGFQSTGNDVPIDFHGIPFPIKYICSHRAFHWIRSKSQYICPHRLSGYIVFTRNPIKLPILYIEEKNITCQEMIFCCLHRFPSTQPKQIWWGRWWGWCVCDRVFKSLTYNETGIGT